MRIVSDLEGMLVLSLSRKNLEGLTRQLDDCNGCKQPAQIMKTLDDRLVIVLAEENYRHYEGGLSGQSHRDDTYGESH